MTPHPCLEADDCYRTCIACLLDLPPETVPKFIHKWGGADETASAREWLEARGLTLVHNPSDTSLTGPCDNGYWWVEFIGKRTCPIP